MTNIHDNNFQVEIALNKLTLNGIIHEQMMTSLSQPTNIDGFTVQLKPYNVSDIDFFVHRKIMYLTLPLNVTLDKRDGIFSIAAHGNMKVQLEIIFDINASLELWTDTSIKNFEWTTRPEVSLGKLDVGVEKLSSWVLDQFKEKVADKIDETIKSKINIRQLILKKFEAYSQNIKVNTSPDMYLNGELVTIKAYEMSSSPEAIMIKIILEVILKVADKKLDFTIENIPVFEWINNLNTPLGQRVEVDISWSRLASLIMTKINGIELGGKTFQVDSVNIRYTNQLEIKANIIQPLKGIITITGLPILDIAAQVIDIKNLTIDIKAENFIYRLSSPVIEKIISTKIESFLPLQLKPYSAQIKTFLLTQQPSFSGLQLVPSVDEIGLASLRFDAEKVSAILQLDNGKLLVSDKLD